MRRHVGRLERRDLDGGVWVLVARDATYTLHGDVPRALAGAVVEVEGDAEEAFGIGMAGPALHVRSVRRA